MTIIAREFRHSDISDISNIFDDQNNLNKLPGLKNMVINSTLIESETGKVVGYGVVKIFAEASMVLSDDLSKREKAAGFVELMKVAIHNCKDAGVEALYVVTKKPSFGKILCNKYGFDSVPGALFELDLISSGDK